MSGKTQFLMEMLLNTSIWYGWRHLVYFPDVGSNVEILADLIHKKTGKSFNPKHANHITELEIQTELDWITHHFLVLTKTEVKAKMTPMEFWDMAVKLKESEGIHTASIDSWKDMSHPYDEFGGYAQYLEYALPYRNQIAEDNDLHLHTIIHPKLTEKERDGSRKAPVPYDLKGGSEWFNSGKNMITVHRPDINSNLVEVMFNKIKPRSVGQIGKISLNYDVLISRYYEQNLINTGGHQVIEKRFASPKDEPIVKLTKLDAVKPVINFYEKPDDYPF
jgi:hypothetical protein